MGFKSQHWKIKCFLASFIITVNEEMRDYFSWKRNQKLIPFGIDTNHYNPASFSVSKSEKTFKIVTVANLVPLKGIEYLIYAVQSLRKKNIELKILGNHNNPYGEDMKSLVKKLKLEEHIIFSGKQLDVRPFLAEADLYIIPTYKKGEGMPMALVEAMSMAVPVLGSNISGIKYVLRDFKHLLFEPGNVQDLTVSIMKIMSKSIEERQNLGKALRKYCMLNLSMDQFIDLHQKLYIQLTKKVS